MGGIAAWLNVNPAQHISHPYSTLCVLSGGVGGGVAASGCTCPS